MPRVSAAGRGRPVAGLVLHLGDEDRLAPQRRRPRDPVALRLHPDDLRVRVLGDLPDQRLAVASGISSRGSTRRSAAMSPRRGPACSGAYGRFVGARRHRTRPLSGVVRSDKSLPYIRPVCRLVTGFSQYCRRGVIPGAVQDGPRAARPRPSRARRARARPRPRRRRARRRRQRPDRPSRRRAGRRPGAGHRVARRVRRHARPRGAGAFEGPAFARVWRSRWPRRPARPCRSSPAPASRWSASPRSAPSGDADAGTRPGGCWPSACTREARHAGHGSRLLNAAVDTLRGRRFTRLTGWVLADDEATRAFLVASGLSPDGAYRDRVVDPDGGVVREVRLVADLPDA